MSHASTAAKVREAKEQHPERYCPEKDCLWRTGGEPCPKHVSAVRRLGVHADCGGWVVYEATASNGVRHCLKCKMSSHGWSTDASGNLVPPTSPETVEDVARRAS